MTALRLVVCLLVVAAAPLGGQEPIRTTAEGIMLDFQDADLRLVLAALAEAGSINLVHPDFPPRRVTLRTTSPVPPDQVLSLLRTLARSNGMTLVEEGAFVRIELMGAQEPPPPSAGTEAPPEEVRLFVYRLKHAQAPRLAGTLQALFRSARVGEGLGSRPRPLPDRMTGRNIPPLEAAEETEVGPALPSPGLQAEIRGDILIVADEMTNSLLVRAQPSDWEAVEQAIEALDLRPLQVLIEVVIAEVRHSDDTQWGLSAGFRDSRRADRLLEGELPGTDAEGFSLRGALRGSVDVDVALSALATRGRVRILSRPIILAQNNQEARILVGSERPFVQVSRSLPTDGAARDQIIQYRDVGTSLTILPTINPDGYVNLQLTQEVSTATAETQFGAPVISAREATTHLLARDGQTVAIGGLVERQTDWTRSGIPILKDIPLLGGLFGSTRSTDTDNELFLFLTPYIVASDEDADRMRERIRNDPPEGGSP